MTTSATPKNATPKKIDLNLHQGSTLMHLAALHKDGFSAVIELVQNFLDANAHNAKIIIDAKQRTIAVFDDGNGADLGEMQDKFSQIGNSLKKGDSNTFGKKGIGGLSAFVVSSIWEFTTKRKNSTSPYIKYTLDSSQFVKASGIEVHYEEMKVSDIGSSILGVKTSTKVILYDVEKSIINQLIAGREELLSSIQTSFNEKIKQLNINFVIICRCLDGNTHTIEVKSREFRGTEQEAVSINTDFGKIIFKMFLNPKPVNKPVIRISYKDPEDGKRYGFPVSMITTGRTKTTPETRGFLEKGYFEGSIEVGFCNMLPDRGGFVDNAQYKTFVFTVDSFVKDVLKKVIENIELEQSDDRLREVGDKVLGRFREYFKKHPAFVEKVSNKLSSMLALDGSGTGEPASWTPLPKKKKSSKTPRRTMVSEQRDKDQTEKEKVNNSRRVTPNAGIGIVFVYPSDEESFNWQYRFRAGLLEFNCAEDGFVHCSSKNSSLLEDYCTTMMMCAVSEIVSNVNHEQYSTFLQMWIEFRLQK